MATLRDGAEKINIRGAILFDEPMSRHTSFRVGGPAEAYALPVGREDLQTLVNFARQGGHPFWLIGGGTNILVSDRGLPGLVIDTSALSGSSVEERGLRAGAGTRVEELCSMALARGLSGIEFLSGLPGSLGGAVYMNARCYGGDLAGVLEWIEVLHGDEVLRLEADSLDFGYKRSPFQPGGVWAGAVILAAGLRLNQGGDKAAMAARMAELRRDREAKGHYRHPCAGSVFKNDRRLGGPTGAVLERLGLKGRRVGGAAIADYHANIIVNDLGASASDVLALIRLAEQRVREELGMELEREVVLMGDFD